MAGTGRVNLVQGNERFSCSEDKAETFAKCPKVSKAITFAATAGTPIKAVTVPAGAYVTRVGVLCTTAVASADFDVGDGVLASRYIGSITTMRASDIIMSQLTGTKAAVHVGGHYYSAEDTIDVTINATATAGTIKVLVWYTFLT